MKKFMYTYMDKNLVVEVQLQHSPDLSPLLFLSVGTFKKPSCVHRQFKMKLHLTKALLMPIEPFATNPGL